MPSQSDHVRRDAGHAARYLIRIRISQYLRRLDDEAKSYIEQAIADATREGKLVDGSVVGALAANNALSSYGIEPLRGMLEAGDDTEDLSAGFA